MPVALVNITANNKSITKVKKTVNFAILLPMAPPVVKFCWQTTVQAKLAVRSIYVKIHSFMLYEGRGTPYKQSHKAVLTLSLTIYDNATIGGGGWPLQVILPTGNLHTAGQTAALSQNAIMVHWQHDGWLNPSYLSKFRCVKSWKIKVYFSYLIFQTNNDQLCFTGHHIVRALLWPCHWTHGGQWLGPIILYVQWGISHCIAFEC